MSHRREVDPQPAKASLVGWGPLAPEGASRRDDEHTRFWTLAHSRVHIQMPDGRVHEEGPYLENGVTRFRPLIIRCGEKNSGKGCGMVVGEVWMVEKERYGRPFTWASTAWVADRETSPPRVREYCMILDDYSARFPVEAECFRHGVVAVTVTDLLSALPRGVAKLQESGKSATVAASRVVS